MCYEFSYACEGTLIDKLDRAIGATTYFMVCIGQLNYIHSVDNDSIDKSIGLLFQAGIPLHIIPEQELINILNFPLTKKLQVFHGSQVLFRNFIKKYKQ